MILACATARLTRADTHSTTAGARQPTNAPAPRAPVPSYLPPGTRSLTVRDDTHVRAGPGREAAILGKLTRGARVAYKRIVGETATGGVAAADPRQVATSPCRAEPPRQQRGGLCPAWVEIEPLGWLCIDRVSPSPEPPAAAHLPVLPRGKLAPDSYFRVNASDTKVFAKAEDVSVDLVDKVVSTKVMVVGQRTVEVDGLAFVRTDHGLIAAERLSRFWPSDFAGLDLRSHAPLTWPFAWVYAPRGGRGPDVLSEPRSGAPRVRRATRRHLVPMLEEREGFVRIEAGGWIARAALRVAGPTTPPPEVGGSEPWIDVDLDEQVLVAYEGTQPVFATLVSTGKPHHATPAGTYRVRAKAATTSMSGDPRVPERYEVSAVPWAVRFRDGFFIHGAYWHDGFGAVASHGCVNVSLRDAAFLYEWVAPAVPDGWSEVEVPASEGMVVRVRDRQHPAPPSFDYRDEDRHASRRLRGL